MATTLLLLTLSLAVVVTESVATVPPLLCGRLDNNTCMKGAAASRSVPATNATQCCDACYNDTACAAFTFRPDHPTSHACIFHPAAVKTSSGNCTSATMPSHRPPTPAPKGLRNILHVIVDDLRPQLGAYGRAEMHTPNFDRLAARSVLFDRAYVQVALCGPTRNSFMTGRRPDVTRAYDFADNFRERGVGDRWWPMPQIFRENGRLALGTGKVYHPNSPPNFDGANSWSPEALGGRGGGYIDFADDDCAPSPPPPGVPNASSFTPEQVGGITRWNHAVKSGGFSNGIVSCAEPTYQDPNVTAKAIEYLQLARAATKPFYLAVGLHKPHLPFHAPRRCWDLYNESNVSMPTYATFPTDAPPIAFHDNNGHPDVPSPWIPLPPDRVRHLRHGYMACVSFMDEQLGELLDALDDTGLTETTAIIMHGDHGWQLAEGNRWRKMTVFELGTRVPLAISVPWLPASHGTRSAELVEMIDVLPTACELAGVPLPANQSYDGVSLVPALTGGATGKNSSFSQYPRVLASPGQVPPFPLPPNASDLLWVDNRAGSSNRSLFYAVGHSVRTDTWRYTEWVRWNASADAPAWDIPLVGVELYPHRQDEVGDFDSYENANVAADPRFAAVAANLSGALRYFFRWAECRKTLCTPAEMAVAHSAQGMA